ncbi:cytochrome d ubiquinol oxidase subunit II [Microlunatus panaciterrae]|uniref:Cytochrome d ubiquinol oxidase subunit II n=1 Tax=Microlunatus panaciterrae TaxID=400768 RepID=A0ABS2RKW5_9ACTN|nr:cytochrome d ubiquinol oxidase subunit II [Microlunatus panaciterrae]MBM7798811.1 cytochrome d ubiquinol oxidase subunit II [Microlunatus panaciterrae]
MELTTVWFIVIAFLWIGYFVLEGFDFGVGMLVGLLGRDDRERRVLINTIGPVWDGNEVWVLVAGGATFAAFPEWYATLFSGFYLPLLLILVALIIRGVAFEYRGKRPEARWKARWDACIIIGSAVPALLWGVAFGNILRGVPINADGEYVGGFVNLLNPFALLAGVATCTLFLTHGAVFVALKTDGEIRHRANRFAARIGLAAAAVTVALAVWLNLTEGTPVSWLVSALAAMSLVGALVANRLGREGWAFIGSAATIALLFVAAFVSLFPDVMPSSLDPAWNLTTTNAASTPYTLRIMTWAAAVGTPVVLVYQAWTYWTFRKRISVAAIPVEPAVPAETAGR